jgi:hypothetical protein
VSPTGLAAPPLAYRLRAAQLKGFWLLWSTCAALNAAGQLVNGTLAQRCGARRIMTLALGLAALTSPGWRR